MFCKMAQVALIQVTHAGGPCLSPRNNGPQFPGQFSGGSPYPHCLSSLPEDRPSRLNLLQSHGGGYAYLRSPRCIDTQTQAKAPS